MALLQNLFKDGQTYEAFDLVYMTGIFPIKRYDTQSNLNMFAEFNFTNTGGLGQYFGLTTDEVKTLCVEHDLDFSKTKFWYDGYRLDGFDIYNPNAIVELILHKIFDNYWTKTSSMEPIYDCIGRNFDGVKECVIDLVAGSYLHNIEISSSNLEPSSFTCKDDILAYMIHLGYLVYSLDNIKGVRKTEDFRRFYRHGDYGAIPTYTDDFIHRVCEFVFSKKSTEAVNEL